MVDKATVVEVKPKTEQQRVDGFIKEYKELCDRTGYRLVATPNYKARDDGTYSLIIEYGVAVLPKE